MFAVSTERFEELAQEAMDSLPPELAQAVDNVVFTIEDEAPGKNLYGLFHGVSLTERTRGAVIVPSTITLYQTTICAHCNSEAEVRDRVRVTMLHEIGHYFGLGEDKLRELGWA